MAEKTELLRGTLDLLILKAVYLSLPSKGVHGYGILGRIAQITGGALTIGQGALYPALGRLEQRGLLRSWWGTSTNHRRAKYYGFTADSHTRASGENQEWEAARFGMKK